MRRLVLCCLLGMGAGACSSQTDTTPPNSTTESPLCPDLVIQGHGASPSQTQHVATSALISEPAEPVLVRFRKATGVSAEALPRDRETQVLSLGGKLKYHWPSLDTMAVSLTPEAQARLAQDPNVVSISPDKVVHALDLRTTDTVPVRAGMTSEYTWGVLATQANQVWDPDTQGVLKDGAPTGQGITVCVIDSGIDTHHPELTVPFAGGKDFLDGDDNPEDKAADGTWGGGHGTHVSGTIAAQLGSHGRVNADDASLSPEGVVGVAPGVRLLMARVLDTTGSGSTSDVIAALKWCQDTGHAQIASLSLGSPGYDDTENAAFQDVISKGMLVVAASGNGATATSLGDPVYPASYDGVMSVGAVDEKLQHAVFSQGGDKLSVVAPGVNVYSTFPEGQAPFAELSAEGTFYNSNALEYSGINEYEGTLQDCGLGDGLRSCPQATCAGFVAYVDRGDIHFSEKVRNVVSQGARAVIIGNNNPDDDATLAFTLEDPASWPPVTVVPTTTVPTLRALMGHTVHVGVAGADYAYSSGTSMATPHVAGVAALVWSARPSLSNTDVRGILEKTAKPLSDPSLPGTDAARDDYFGYGLVQAKAAVDMALGKTSQP